MDNIIDQFVRLARRCDRAAKPFDQEPIKGVIGRLMEACQHVSESWSGSWLGYHSRTYLEGLRPKNPGEHFDTEMGLKGPFAGRHSFGNWCEYSFEGIRQKIFKHARIADHHFFDEAVATAREVFDVAKERAVPTIDAVLSTNEDAALRSLRDEIEKLPSHLRQEDFVHLWRPRGQFMTRDSVATAEGIRVPLHLQVESWVMERASWGSQLLGIAKLLRRAQTYLELKLELKGKTVAKIEGKVFIGHGGSKAWRDLKDFLVEKCGLEYVEFNSAATAGLTTKERLEDMLEESCFAFLVMTAEDEKADGTKVARANVIHEAGLFQGRLGFRRAIILLEDGCEEFSNIHGLTQIRFPAGNIMAKSEDIRGVLHREEILQSDSTIVKTIGPPPVRLPICTIMI